MVYVLCVCSSFQADWFINVVSLQHYARAPVLLIYSVSISPDKPATYSPASSSLGHALSILHIQPLHVLQPSHVEILTYLTNKYYVQH